jgi:hypothetical protein
MIEFGEERYLLAAETPREKNGWILSLLSAHSGLSAEKRGHVAVTRPHVAPSAQAVWGCGARFRNTTLHPPLAIGIHDVAAVRLKLLHACDPIPCLSGCFFLTFFAVISVQSLKARQRGIALVL